MSITKVIPYSFTCLNIQYQAVLHTHTLNQMLEIIFFKPHFNKRTVITEQFLMIIIMETILITELKPISVTIATIVKSCFLMFAAITDSFFFCHGNECMETRLKC